MNSILIECPDCEGEGRGWTDGGGGRAERYVCERCAGDGELELDEHEAFEMGVSFDEAAVS